MAGAGAFALAADLTMSLPARRGAPSLAGGIAVVSLIFSRTIQGFFDLLWTNGIGTMAMWVTLVLMALPGRP